MEAPVSEETELQPTVSSDSQTQLQSDVPEATGNTCITDTATVAVGEDLNPNGYASERWKLEIKNLPLNFGFGVRTSLSKMLKVNILDCLCLIATPQAATVIEATLHEAQGATAVHIRVRFIC